MQRRRLGQPGRRPEPGRRSYRHDRGWDVRTVRNCGGRGTPGVTYHSISTLAQRSAPNCEITFTDARVPAANLIEGTKGNGDLLINRNFAWSGPVAGIGAVAVARAAYEDALQWAKKYTAGGPKPIINYQYPGYVLVTSPRRLRPRGTFAGKPRITWINMTITAR